MSTKPGSDRIEEILSALSLDEKIKLLGGHPNHEEPRDGDVYGVPRVGLPRLRFADGPVGVHWWTKASTCYPALICLAASFDEKTAERYGEAIGKDCRAAGVHVLLAPGVNLYRSPLCGRNFEYLGEDPELSGKLAAAYIRGVQSQGVAATVKHFAANNQEYDRHNAGSDIDERTLREVYLRPFELAVTEGEVSCVMTSYNPVNQVHASENAWLIRDVLRNTWGFEGVVMSDWTSVYSTAQSLHAGLDLEMPWGRFLNRERILPLLETGVLTESVIDERVRARLRLMARFGWLDPSHEQKDASIPSRNLESEAVALDVARKGIVLLKNDAALLPQRPGTVRRITVLGHHASHAVLCGGGSAYCPPHESVTLLDALRRMYGEDTTIEQFDAVDLWRERQARTYPTYRTPDGQAGLRAEYFDNNQLAGQPTLVRTDARPSFDWIEKKPDPALTGKFFSVRWTGSFDVAEGGEHDFYLTLNDGDAAIWLDGELLTERASETRRFTRALSAGSHELRIEYRQWRSGWSVCHIGFESVAHALLQYTEGLESARASDLVIVTAGFVAPTEGEGHDRTFALDPRLDRLILDAAQANANTAVVLYAGGAVDVAPWVDCVKALLCVFYPGQNGTIAAAEILAGITNPSGKLPFTWETRLEDRGSASSYHDTDGDHRVSYDDGVFTGYRWFDKKGIAPRYPFGHGLSYTSFSYGALERVSTGEPARDGVTVRASVTNTGSAAGEESVLFFVYPPAESSLRPLRELKGSRRVSLAPGETKSVEIHLPPRAFARWDEKSGWLVEAGDYRVEARASAGEGALAAEFSVAVGEWVTS
jgi:beta-glucosidase